MTKNETFTYHSQTHDTMRKRQINIEITALQFLNYRVTLASIHKCISNSVHKYHIRFQRFPDHTHILVQHSF